MSGTKNTGDKSNSLTMKEQPGKSHDALLAELATNGIVNSATLVVDFSKSYIGELSLTDCMDALGKKAKTVHGGDMKDVETMLVAQAAALDTIFVSLARRAALNMGEYIGAAEKYMRLSLKAQGQCRATLETLAEIKNPQPYIQNNKAINQQVNNGPAPSGGNSENNTRTGAGARVEKNPEMTNGLLEDHSNEWLDTGAAGAAGGTDKELATVAAGDRAENG